MTRWKRAIAKTGLTDFRFHDLRHTAASRVLRETGNLAVVQEMLGHAQVTTTRKYAHVLNEDLRAAMERTQAATPPSRRSDPQGFPQGQQSLKRVGSVG